jgi:hypothetical protein
MPRLALALCTLAFCALASAAAAAADVPPSQAAATPEGAPSPAAPPALEIYSRARAAWRRRSIPPVTRYKITAVYEASGKLFREDFHCVYRERNGRLTAFNVPVPQQENLARLRGFQLWLWFPVVDTNPVEHPPMKIPTPQIIPYAPLGLGPVGAESEDAIRTPLETAPPSGLREVGRVVSVNRNYDVALAGIERILDTQTYHLTLTPLREPRTYKLRELWVDTQTFDIVRIVAAGVDAVEPLGREAARIDFATVDGRRIIERISALETLKAFRNVKHLSFFFREYEFSDRESPQERYELNFTPPR